MPYIVDLKKKCRTIMETTVRPYGWIPTDKDSGGVTVEFGTTIINQFDPEPSMCMRVKNTEHTWCWFQHTFYNLASDNYAEFFTKQLEEFRIEFLLWIRDPNTRGLPWVKEYYDMFKGCFYDFSPEEQRQYEQSKREWEEDQQQIDNGVAEFKRIQKEGYRVSN